VAEHFLFIDHVQLAMPAGEESIARDFYSGLLGMNEVQKPSELAKRGGCWFESGSVRIHLGVEHDFCPAKKAHPAIRCSDYDGLLAKLHEAAVEITAADEMPGVHRCHIHDPFGNRIEFIAGESSQAD
jgi:catechol 2,3-dioxygenase-like lactoylglutathione lyase family enzyme